jgi:hypothetical protein
MHLLGTYVLKTNCMILDFFLDNVILNIDVLGSITLLVVIGVLYYWLIIAVYLKWLFYIVDYSKSGNKFLKSFCLLGGLITSNKLHIHCRRCSDSLIGDFPRYGSICECKYRS